MKNNEIDTLIDSAFAKDRSNMPEIPAQPDPSLLSQLKTPLSSASGSAFQIAGSKAGFFTGGMMKMAIGIIGIGGISVASSLYFSKNDNPVPMHQPVISRSIDSLVKPRQDSGTAEKAGMKKDELKKDENKGTARADSVLTIPDRHIDDLLPAVSKTKTNEGITVPIKRGNPK